MLNQEDLFKAIQKENWDSLISILHKNKKLIASDSLLSLAARTFENEFLKKVKDYPNDKKEITNTLESLWLLHQGGYFKLTEDNHKQLVCEIVKRKNENLAEAYNFAKTYPKEEICKAIITEYERLVPKKVEHSQQDKIKVTETREIASVDYTINLFKSYQEIEFFNALKNTFPTYQVYPNVVISCLLNWQYLQYDLDEEEKKLFFRGIVDFVVFDQVEGFKPIYFFEIDSVFHDTEEQKIKDRIKDSIFSKAGVRIKRIRKTNKMVGEQEFIKLIRDLIK